jgi:hypothetical protein
MVLRMMLVAGSFQSASQDLAIRPRIANVNR